MEPNNQFDNPAPMGYNVENDTHEIVVSMADQAPVHDTSCVHETLVPDLEDTIGKSVYHGCANPKCNVGVYLQIK
jgi:hypothetical protein